MINVLTGINTTASALEAERIRMDVIGQNIANAEVSRAPGAKPYQRQQVVFETLLNEHANQIGVTGGAGSTVAARIETDNRPPRMVYQPGNPHADAKGMVALPDINTHEEMADLITASRAFEANLAVVRNARSMAMQTLAIGKR
ncbi:MAG: flagellar basal body rod protein FlgC [Verrucomicrobiota bacterium]